MSSDETSGVAIDFAERGSTDRYQAAEHKKPGPCSLPYVEDFLGPRNM
jgi:hypothetical protein